MQFVHLQANINLNFLYFLMATATTSAVPPLASSVMWARCSKVAALSGVPPSCLLCTDLFVLASICFCKHYFAKNLHPSLGCHALEFNMK